MRKTVGAVVFVAVVLVVFGVGCPGGTTGFQKHNVEVVKDDFKGHTTVQVKEVLIRRDFGVTYSFRMLGIRDGQSPALFTFESDAGTGSWRFLKCNDVTLLADGVRIDPGDERHDGYPDGDGVVETVTVSLTKEDLQRLATSKQARARVCSTEFEVTAVHKQYFAEFLEKWSGETVKVEEPVSESCRTYSDCDEDEICNRRTNECELAE